MGATITSDADDEKAQLPLLRLRWGEVACQQSNNHHDNSDALGCIQLVLPLRPSTQGCGRRGGARDTDITVQISTSKRSVHVWPTKGTHMYVSWMNELNALQTCIWLKTDLLTKQKPCVYIYIYRCAYRGWFVYGRLTLGWSLPWCHLVLWLAVVSHI